MGKVSAAGADQALKVVTESFSSAVAGVKTFSPNTGGSKFNASMTGTFVGTVKLQKSYDGGTTWIDTGTQFTAPGTAIIEEPEHGCLYRWNCSAYTSGTANGRLSQ